MKTLGRDPPEPDALVPSLERHPIDPLDAPGDFDRDRLHQAALDTREVSRAHAESIRIVGKEVPATLAGSSKCRDAFHAETVVQKTACCQLANHSDRCIYGDTIAPTG